MNKLFNFRQFFFSAEPKFLFRQAAFFYGLNAVVFLTMFGSKAPFHNFGLWSMALFTAGVFMMILFTVLIYRGYRKLTLVLACIASIRLVVTILKIPLFTYIISLVLILEGFTCFMLFRASLDFKSRPLVKKNEKVDGKKAT